MLDNLLFVVFPYVAVAVAVGGTVYRFLTNQFSFTSLSSQFLESDLQFWGSTLWHYGIIPTLVIHMMGFGLPKVMEALHGTPETLYLAELAGKILAIMAFVGAAVLFYRRVSQSKIRVVTTPADWVVMVLLIFQVVLGLWIAFGYRWGATWFVHTVTPWVASLATFQPAPQFVSALPLVPKLHFLNATLLILVFPFTRLVHIITVPVEYLWRSFQRVIWTRRKVV
jgi:nitrate reductase gamma subunit